MRATVLFIAIFALAMLVVPMIAMSFEVDAPSPEAQVHSPVVPSSQESAPQPEAPVIDQETDEPDTDEPVDADDQEQAEAAVSATSVQGVDSFRILDQSTGSVLEVSVRDYVRGAVAAEMPVSFHSEALKAQAVAAHTYALHHHYTQQQTPDPELNGADFAADPADRKVFMTEEQAKEFYGARADLYWNKICTAVDSVLDEILEYDGEAIVAAYHAISAGQTEDASNVWVGSAPYLVAAESEGDLLAPDYESSATFTIGEVEAALTAAFPEIDLSGDPQEWFSTPVRSASGYVTEVEVGGLLLHGKEIREVLDLRSHNFDVLYDDSGFTFLVTGYGHGVGMSQYGADFLARQGYTYDEILANYYPGASLRQLG